MALDYKASEKWLLIATILGSSLAFIDGTIINVALPAIQEGLHTTISRIQWVVEAYSLTLAALLLVGGAIGDLFGRKIIFLLGVIIFALASAWCGFAPSISQLIIARGIQGVGAALLVPGSLALISVAFSEDRRGQAIGTWAGFTAITSAAGPVLGGWLVQHLSWRAVFFINLPIAVIVLLITILGVAESRSEQQERKLDLVGACLATLGLGAIVFGLIEWGSETTLVILFSEVVGFFTLVGFFIREAIISYPMVRLEIFKSRNFSGANLITFFLYFALYGVFFFLPLDLIQVEGYSATQAGAALLPVIFLIFLLSRWAGGLVKQFGAKLPLIIGPAIAAIGFALFLRSGINNSYWISFFPASALLGVGVAMSVAPLTTVVMNSISPNQAGAASGINNAISRIAGLLAIAIFGLVMTNVFDDQLMKGLKSSTIPFAVQQEIFEQRSLLANIKTDDEQVHRLVQESFVAGYRAIVVIAALFSLASCLSAAIFITNNNASNSFYK